VLKALNDPVKSEQKELVAKFTWRNSARQMLNLYQKALADHQELKSLLDQASSQKSRGDLKSALNSYLKALEIHPHSPLALTEAAELLTLEKDPHADIYSEKLNTISRERSDKCVLNIPLKLQDDFIFAEMEPAEIALNLLNNGAIFEAEDMLQKELALNPSNDRALYGLGLVYFKRGKFTRAKDFLQKSVELKPSGDNLLYLASVLEKLNLCDQALLYLSQIRQIPGTDGNFDFDINRLKGHCLLKKGDFEQAEKCYHLASEIDPQSEKPWLGLGSIELLRKNFPRSQGYYHQALILNPASDKAHLGLALVDLEQGQFDSALEKVKAALDLNLENQQALMTCLNAAHRSGKLEVAQKYLARYSDLHPANTEILYTLAGIFTRLGNKEDAKATAHKILLLNPDHQPAAELLKQLG
jgi:tetratricopeptide (TPR) repeat protein